MCTSSLVTTKCTSAPRPKVSSGSPSGLRSCVYCLRPASRFCVRSVLSSMVATGMPLTNSARSSLLPFLLEYSTCRITRNRFRSNLSTLVWFRDVAGRGWNSESLALSTPTGALSTFSVPPAFIGSVARTCTRRSRICLRPCAWDPSDASGLTIFASCSGCVAANQANTSSGNSARSRS